LSLSEWFGDAPRVVDITAGGAARPMGSRRTTFRLGGCRTICWCCRT
jgi:hypothetical protein